jgi:hypothetical protein
VPTFAIADRSLLTVWDGTLDLDLEPGRESWILLVFDLPKGATTVRLRVIDAAPVTLRLGNELSLAPQLSPQTPNPPPAITSPKQQSSPNKTGNSAQLLDEGRRWVSEDKAYAFRLPKGWEVRDLPLKMGSLSAAAQIPGSRAFVVTHREPASRRATPDEQLRELQLKAAQNAPPTMGSSGFENLKPGRGTIAGLPTAWSGLAFTDRDLGPTVSLAYAIGGPKATYIIEFGLVPRSQFDRLRPVFEAIVKSFELLE